jgi:hypothetical protein
MKHLPLLLLLLTSCVTERKCNRLFPPTVEKETITTVIRRDSTIQGEKVTDVIHLHDTTVIRYITNNVTVRESASGMAELRYWKDAYGNLVMECESKDRQIEWHEQHRVTINTITRTVTPDWVWVVVAAAVAMLIVCVVAVVAVVRGTKD